MVLVSKALCKYCEKINFDALRGPSDTDLKDVIARRINGERLAQLKPGTTVENVSLGPLSRIREDASRCPLCSLFYEVVVRQGATYRFGSVLKTLDCDDVVFRADSTFFIRIFGGRSTNNGHFVLRRLSLTGHLVNSPDNCIAYFDHVLQACDVGTFLNHDTHQEVPRMHFGGRRRPPRLDLQLIHDWIHICSEKHGQACTLDSTRTNKTE